MRAHERVFGQVVLLKFSRLHTEAESCLEDATEHLIMRAMRSDATIGPTTTGSSCLDETPMKRLLVCTQCSLSGYPGG